MKFTTYLAGFLLLFSSVFFTHCTADRGSVSTPRELLTEGSWSVQSLHTGGSEAGQLAGYTFTFGAGNRVTARLNGEALTGNWRWIRNAQAEVLDLQLPDHSPLEALDDQWTLEQWGLYSLRLKRGADVLVLRKLAVL